MDPHRVKEVEQKCFLYKEQACQIGRPVAAKGLYQERIGSPGKAIPNSIKGKGKEQSERLCSLVVTGSYLLSRAVASQVPSAFESLTSVFGMGTGGSSQLSPPVW